VDAALVAAARSHALVVTAEDNGVAGGFGDAVGRALRAAAVPADLLTLGLRQEYLDVGSREALLAGQGLDGDGIAAAVLARLRPARAVRSLG
jgi:1-deoxy-D-xylulose-5-phosphate synthase